MPEKGDITDWVKAHPQLSTNELVGKLEKAIAIAVKRNEQEKQKQEQEEQLASLPNWSQSDIAEYLAEKYCSKLAWNVDEQEWYRYDSEARTNVGVARRDKDSNSPYCYLDTEKWLYPNYCEYCHNSGTKAVSLRRFVSLLSDLGKNQLGLDIRKERDRFGSYFVGLKIRTAEDDLPPMITGNTNVLKDLPSNGGTATHIAINVNPQTKNTNVINKLWTMVMDRVTDMMDYMMDENVGSDEYDECDGIFQKSSKLETSLESKVSCNTNDQEDLEKKEISQEFLKMPSPSSHKQAETQTEGEVTGSQVAPHSRASITVGDRVTVEDCPGHWSWASPFTVEAVDGEWAKLEMVGELVEMERLSRL